MCAETIRKSKHHLLKIKSILAKLWKGLEPISNQHIRAKSELEVFGITDTNKD